MVGSPAWLTHSLTLSGLDIPHIHGDGGMSKKELKAKEEDLTNYFLYEMKKAPKAK